MSRIICLQHPKYNGKSNPELRCHTCCSIFVERIRAENGPEAQDVTSWLASKIKKAPLAARG